MLTKRELEAMTAKLVDAETPSETCVCTFVQASPERVPMLENAGREKGAMRDSIAIEIPSGS